MVALHIVGGDSESRRIADALLELIVERGYSETTLEALRERAGVDAAAFARNFSSLQDCSLTVWKEIDAELDRRIAAALDSPGPWRERLRAALDASLRFLAADEGRARLYVTEILFSGGEVTELRMRPIERLASIVDLGRAEMADPARLPPLIATAIAGGVWHRIVRLVQAGRNAELPAELSDLMYVCVLPYADAETAQEELRRSA